MQSLRATLDSASDLSSCSDELAVAGTPWPAGYFLSPARANVVRSLSLEPAGTVLEIGSRAGALTRYLGEEATLVDGLEPDPDFADLAATRCADLPGVQVFDCWIDDVPPESTYDLIVAVDVMGEIASRGVTLAAFLATCRDRLADDGVVVLCADNADGVRRAGSGGLPAAGIVSASPPTRVALAEITSAAQHTGLRTWTGSAFPDHRLTQIVFSHDALADFDRTLLTSLPRFPSPPYGSPALAPQAEAEAWVDAVEADRASDRANSFVVMLSRTTPSIPDVAVYWSRGRRAALSACNRVGLRDGRKIVDRQAAYPEAPLPVGPLRLDPHVEPFVEGTTMIEALRSTDSAAEARHLLQRWVGLLAELPADADVPWDLIPRNIVIDGADRLHAIDQEWSLQGCDVDTVLDRGCFWSATDLLAGDDRPAWLPGRTVGQVADVLRRLADERSPGDWIARFLRAEAAATSHVPPARSRQSRTSIEHENGRTMTSISHSVPDERAAHDRPDDDASLQSVIDSLLQTNDELRARIHELELERRHDALVHRDQVLGLTTTAETFRNRHQISQASLSRARAKITKLQKRNADMQRSVTWRLGSLFVRPIARLRGRR